MQINEKYHKFYLKCLINYINKLNAAINKDKLQNNANMRGYKTKIPLKEGKRCKYI
jgi:hypothetical protein